jgi:hypothetical protein
MSAIALKAAPMFDRARANKQDQAQSTAWVYGIIAFCLLHIPLALLLHRSSLLSTMHALAAFAVGVWWAFTSPERPIRVAFVGAYITGAEVLWRMTESQVFWEFGKYAVSAIFILSILRRGRFKGPAAMFAFFALLVPSALITVTEEGADARGYLSFFMSGPFSMMVAAWFFSQLKLSVEDVRRVLIAACGPIVGIAAITFFGIYATNNIQFNGESNFLTSGGFGPNQVAAVLGLGAMFVLMFLVLHKTPPVLKTFLIAAMLFMTAQSALTFSRGGIYNAVGATALASVYLIKEARTRRSFMLVAVVAVVLGAFVIFPRLESLTSGKLGERFAETNTTNRVEIIQDQLWLWNHFPVLGVGPGRSRHYGVATAHTEFMRLPAEHGSLGFIAFGLLVMAAVNVVRRAKTNKGKAIAVFLVGWSFLYMLTAALRLVSPSFVFGLAFALVLPETNPRALRALVDLLRLKIGERRLQRVAAPPLLGS